MTAPRAIPEAVVRAAVAVAAAEMLDLAPSLRAARARHAAAEALVQACGLLDRRAERLVGLARGSLDQARRRGVTEFRAGVEPACGLIRRMLGAAS